MALPSVRQAVQSVDRVTDVYPNNHQAAIIHSNGSVIALTRPRSNERQELHEFANTGKVDPLWENNPTTSSRLLSDDPTVLGEQVRDLTWHKGRLYGIGGEGLYEIGFGEGATLLGTIANENGLVLGMTHTTIASDGERLCFYRAHRSTLSERYWGTIDVDTRIYTPYTVGAIPRPQASDVVPNMWLRFINGVMFFIEFREIYRVNTVTGERTDIQGATPFPNFDRPSPLANHEEPFIAYSRNSDGGIYFGASVGGGETNWLYETNLFDGVPLQTLDEGGTLSVDVEPFVVDATSIAFRTGYTVPAWVTLTDFTLSGTAPAVQGDQVVTLEMTATNSEGDFDFDVVVTIRDLAPRIEILPTFTVGISTYFQESLHSFVNATNFSLSFRSGYTPPSWLDLSGFALFGTTPLSATTQVFNVEMTATNANGSTDFDVIVTVRDLSPLIIAGGLANQSVQRLGVNVLTNEGNETFYLGSAPVVRQTLGYVEGTYERNAHFPYFPFSGQRTLRFGDEIVINASVMLNSGPSQLESYTLNKVALHQGELYGFATTSIVIDQDPRSRTFFLKAQSERKWIFDGVSPRIIDAVVFGTAISFLPAPFDQVHMGIASTESDGTNLYVIPNLMTEQDPYWQLYRIDPDTGVNIQVGTLQNFGITGLDNPQIAWLSGTMYTVDSGTLKLYTVDLTTGRATPR